MPTDNYSYGLQDICKIFYVPEVDGQWKHVVPTNYAKHIYGRIVRSVDANKDELKTSSSDKIKKCSEIAENYLFHKLHKSHTLPETRIGSNEVLDQIISFFVCRSKKSKDFHYGICASKDNNNIWRKICSISVRGKDIKVISRKTEDVTIG